jgi:hypothetical protein
MAAYELSTTSQALLARVAQSDTAALLALSDDKNAVGGGQRAAAVLAGLAMSALYAIDTAEAQADGELRRMARLVDDQSKAA